MTNTQVLPERFLLTPERLAAALDLARLRPTSRAGMGGLPSVRDAVAVLKGTTLVTPQGTLVAGAEAALRVAADPRRVVSVLSLFAGDPHLRQATFLQAAEGTPVVVQRREKQGWDLVLLSSIAQAVVMVDDLLSLSRLPSQPGSAVLELDLAGYAALLSAADVLQARRIAARSSRGKLPPPTLSLPLLMEQFEAGLKAVDTRWAVTAGRLVAPVDLRHAASRLPEGLEQLHRVGLVKSERGEAAFTREGFVVAGPLGYLLNASGLVATEATAGGHASLGTTNLFRTMASIFVLIWTEVQAADGQVRLRETSAAGALSGLRAMFEPTRANSAG
jgi:hypothetical protein